jgi:predicted DNA-binding transcriptional regulator YafY
VSRGARLLQHNPEPIKIVPQAVRDVWKPKHPWRCCYEDGRGRCTSRETRVYPMGVEDGRRIWEAYCEKHAPKEKPA